VEVVDERIESLLEIIKSEIGEIPLSEVDRHPDVNFDPLALSFLRGEISEKELVGRAEYKEKSYTLVMGEFMRFDKSREFMESVIPKIDQRMIAVTYGYKVICPVYEEDAVLLHLAYVSSSRDFRRFEVLSEEYDRFVDQWIVANWDAMRYAEWLYEYDMVLKPKLIVLDYYRRWRDYIDVYVLPPVEHDKYWMVEVYTAKQLKGILIGRGGRTVRELEVKLGEELGGEVRVRVEESPLITEKYYRDNPELPDDPRVLELLAKIIPLLRELEEYIPLEQLIDWYKAFGDEMDLKGIKDFLKSSWKT